MKRIISLLMSVSLAVSALFTPMTAVRAEEKTETVEFYVSADGDDSNSGTIDAPFATLEKARDIVYEAKQNQSSDIIVYLRGGTYALDRTFELSYEDSGENGYQITYQAYPGETPVITGSKELTTDWEIDNEDLNIYKTYVGEQRTIRHLYIDGKRGQRAQSETRPEGFGYHSEYGFSIPAEGKYADMGNWRNPSDIEMHQIVRWTDQWQRVENIEDGKMIMAQPAWSMNQETQYQRVSYPDIIENAYELLDTPNEWYYDKTDGYLYYIPSAEHSLDSSFAVPEIERLIAGNLTELGGSVENVIQNIKFKGLTFSWNTWLEPLSEEGWIPNQASMAKHKDAQGVCDTGVERMPKAALDFRYCSNIVVEDCVFTELATSAIAFGTGSQNNIVRNNTVTNIGITGIQFGDFNDLSYKPNDKREIVKDNVVERNYVENVGVEQAGSVGILGGYVKNLQILHNTLKNLPYTGISVGWGHGWIDHMSGYDYETVGDNKIMYNRIDNYLLKANDGGGIYTLSAQKNSEIRYNYISSQHRGFGYVYLDNGTQGYTVEDNVIDQAEGSWNRWLHLNCDFGYDSEWSARHNSVKYNYYLDGMGINTVQNNIVDKNFAYSRDSMNQYAVEIKNCAGINGKDMSLERPKETHESAQYYQFINRENPDLKLHTNLADVNLILNNDNVNDKCYQWKIADTENGYVKIENRQREQMLTSSDNYVAANNTMVVWGPIGDTINQQYKIREREEGLVSIVPRVNENLQAAPKTMDNGEIKVITANKDDTSLNQQWIMSPVVKTPYITPEREIIDENQQIRIESDTEDAVFYYTTDGTVPELKEDDQYTEPFYVTKDTTLNIIGTKAGYSNSELVTIELKMDDEIVAPAKADVESGAYAQKFNVNLSSETKDTKIYYTLDGTDPSYYNELYSNYGTIQIEKDTVLKTIAYKEGKPSEISEYVYTIEKEREPAVQYYYFINKENKDYVLHTQLNDPHFIFDGKDTDEACYQWNVIDAGNGYVKLENRRFEGKILTAENNWIYAGNTMLVYDPIGDTVNQQFKITERETGVVSILPRVNENLQLAPVVNSSNNKIVLGIADKNDEALSQQWFMTPVVKTPYASVDGGTIEEKQIIQLATETEGAFIYYTIDGTNPEITEENKYTQPFEVTPGTTLMMIAVKDGYINSEKVVIEYNGKELPKVQEPEFIVTDNAAGGVELEIRSNTRNTKIYYTLDGSEPTSAADLYKEKLIFTEDAFVRAIALKEGFDNSAVKEIEIKVPVNKIVLKEVIEQAEAVDLSLYLDGETKESFKEILTAANIVFANEEATQPEINEAVESLRIAIANLEKAVYTVTVDGEVVAVKKYNEKITVQAPVIEGRAFTGWLWNHKVVSVNEVYSFYVSEDTELTTCYEEIKVEADALLTNTIFTKRADGKADVKFVGQVIIPEGCTIENAGLVWSSKEENELSLNDGSSKVTYITKISDTNQFSVTIKGMPEERAIRGKIFATLVDEEGNRIVVYSEEGKCINK